jgi:hypothetical protein
MHFGISKSGGSSPNFTKHGSRPVDRSRQWVHLLQWAVRLRNEKVAEELRQLVGTERQPADIAAALSAIVVSFCAHSKQPNHRTPWWLCGMICIMIQQTCSVYKDCT